MDPPGSSGLASEIRGRLLIDRYSSILTHLPVRRQAALGEPGSLDAEIWNVFRTLAQLDPRTWVPRLLSLGRIGRTPETAELSAGIGLTLWKRVKPPPERLVWLRKRALSGELRPPVGRRRKGRVIPLSELRSELRERARRRLPLEDPVEVDVIVKCSRTVVFVEIPRSGQAPDDPAPSDSGRTHLLRLIDAGLSYAESRSRAHRGRVGFALLILPSSPEAAEAWARAARPFTLRPAGLRRVLPHRGSDFDPGARLDGVGTGSWSEMRDLLSDLRRRSQDPLEMALLDRLLHRGMRVEAPAAI